LSDALIESLSLLSDQKPSVHKMIDLHLTTYGCSKGRNSCCLSGTVKILMMLIYAKYQAQLLSDNTWD